MNKSFTLIEILVVIVVIGILSSFILVGMSSISESANIAKSKAFIDSLDNSLLLARVSEWKLDDTSGTSASDSWLTNTGTLTNFADTSSGYGDTHDSGWMSTNNCISGTCLKFDGIDDYINCGNNGSLTISESFSFGLWVKLLSLPSADTTLLIKGTSTPSYDNYLIYLEDYGALAGYVGKSDASGSVSRNIGDINNSKWHYAFFTFNSVNGFKGFLDGRQVGSTASTGFTAYNDLSRNVYIGYRWGTIYPKVIIDDVHIYNQALSTSQIEQNYFLGLNKLFKNNGITFNEFNERIVELKSNLANNE
ncbi:MAG: hypothetical protein MCSN_0870 [Candidatus Microsyncoccus archaeolyticus]|nr:MAG: hypothetical protein MCSN_0870 [Candidatus Parcubacteria bacterium]